jgi:hypothetical protein
MNDFSSKYAEFISHIKNVFPNNVFLEKILNESIEEQLNRVKKLDESLSSITLFNYFLKNKIKLLSHKEKDTTKVSESMFGSEITLKKVFNNQDETVKLLFWTDLKKLVLSYYKHILPNNPNDKKIVERIQLLESNTSASASTAIISASNNSNNINPKDSLNKILNTENLNETTNSMINDIFSTFEQSLNQPNSNPFANIMQISQVISEKYKNNIENGDVNLDDLLSNMTNLPGMENMGGLISSLTKQMQPSNTEPAEKVIIDENFSTAIVPKGEQKEDNSNINVGELLKTMDSFGALGLGNPTDENGMGKLMDIFSKLSNTSDPSKLNEIMESDLGIDMAKFTNEMSKVIGKND